MSSKPTSRRPAIVTVISVLIFLGVPFAAFWAIASFLAAADLADGSAAGTPEAMSPLIFVVEGAFFAVVAIVSVILGIGLLRGNNAARVWTTVVIVLSASQTAFSLTGGHRQALTDSIYLVLLITAGILLWSPKAGTFFRLNRSESKRQQSRI